MYVKCIYWIKCVILKTEHLNKLKPTSVSKSKATVTMDQNACRGQQWCKIKKQVVGSVLCPWNVYTSTSAISFPTVYDFSPIDEMNPNGNTHVGHGNTRCSRYNVSIMTTDHS